MARKRKKTDVEKLKEFSKGLDRALERCRAAWRDDPEDWYMTRYTLDEDLGGMYPDGNDPFGKINYLVQGFSDWRVEVSTGGKTGNQVLQVIGQHDEPLVGGVLATCKLVGEGWSAMGKEFAKGQAPAQEALL